MQLTPDNLYSPFFGCHGSIVTFLRLMQQHDLSPAAALDMYEQYMDALQADMLPVPSPPDASPDVRRAEGQPDAEYRLGACPKCRKSEVWGIKKCPHISPPWRTFFACDAPDCSYHGRSRLAVDVLRRQWPTGAEEED